MAADVPIEKPGALGGDFLPRAPGFKKRRSPKD